KDIIVKSKYKLYIANMTEIDGDGDKLLSESLLSIVHKDSPFPYIGNFSNTRPSEYIKQKFVEYYNILIEYPDIKIQYIKAEEIVKPLALEEPIEVADPEDLLKKTSSVK